jgi:hypothetical protein
MSQRSWGIALTPLSGLRNPCRLLQPQVLRRPRFAEMPARLSAKPLGKAGYGTRSARQEVAYGDPTPLQKASVARLGGARVYWHLRNRLPEILEKP